MRTGKQTGQMDRCQTLNILHCISNPRMTFVDEIQLRSFTVDNDPIAVSVKGYDPELFIIVTKLYINSKFKPVQ